MRSFKKEIDECIDIVQEWDSKIIQLEEWYNFLSDEIVELRKEIITLRKKG